MSETINNYFSAPFLKLKLVWDSCVNKIFGKYSQNVRNYFSYLGTKAIFRMIETFLVLIATPFREAFWLFMDLHIGLKVDHVIKSLQLDIHENLLYQLTDQFIKVLKEGEKEEDKATSLDQIQILKAAERRDRKEKIEVLDYIKRIGLKQIILT